MEKSEKEARLRAAAAAAIARHLGGARSGRQQPVAAAGSRWARAGRRGLMRKTVGSLESGG